MFRSVYGELLCTITGTYMSNHFYLGFTKVVYGMLYFLVYHQCSLVNEIGPPHKRATFV